MIYLFCLGLLIAILVPIFVHLFINTDNIFYDINIMTLVIEILSLILSIAFIVLFIEANISYKNFQVLKSNNMCNSYDIYKYNRTVSRAKTCKWFYKYTGWDKAEFIKE